MSYDKLGPSGVFAWILDEVPLPDGTLVQVHTQVIVYDGAITHVLPLAYVDEQRRHELIADSPVCKVITEATRDFLEARWDRRLDGVVCDERNRV